jgi:hypothetical protein
LQTICLGWPPNTILLILSLPNSQDYRHEWFIYFNQLLWKLITACIRIAWKIQYHLNLSRTW